MWWFSNSNIQDTEIQRRFPPEALQAVFDHNRGDVSKLEKPLQAMTKAVETSSSEVQRSLLRELKVSGVVGFACTLLLVYGQKDQAFAWACEVLRLVQIIEENDIADSLNQMETAQRRRKQEQQQENTSKSKNTHHHDDTSTSSVTFTTPTIACAVVPLLRAAATRLPSLQQQQNNSTNQQSSGGFYPAVAFFASLATSAASTVTSNSASQQIVLKYSSLIVSSSILGILPDYGAEEVFSSHSHLALQTLSRIVTPISPAVLSSSDAALCAPLAAACVLASSREQIEGLLLPKSTSNNNNNTTLLGTAIMDPLSQLRLWRESNKLCLQIFQRASNSVRPRDVAKISAALEHVLRYFFAPGEEGALLSRLKKNANNNESFQQHATTTSDSATIELRVSFGQLICEAAQVLFCAANDGWLPISRSFFDHLVDAAFISLQDPETVISFGACFSCLPRVSSVALRGGCINVHNDILPRINKLWDKVDSDLSNSFVPTVNRDALIAVANGIQSWVAEFYTISNPGGQTTTDQKREFDHRKLAWGSQARRFIIDNRVVDTVLKLFDLCCTSLVVVDTETKNADKKKDSKKNTTTTTSNKDDSAFALWFPQLWHTGVLFTLLRESRKFVKEITSQKNRDLILKFAQTTATVTCPILLEFWHVLENVASSHNNNSSKNLLRASASSSSDGDGDDDNENRKKQKKKPQKLDQSLLERLYDACRFVRRDQPPPEFVIRTLKLLVANPCPTCSLGIPYISISNHLLLLPGHHHHHEIKKSKKLSSLQEDDSSSSPDVTTPPSSDTTQIKKETKTKHYNPNPFLSQESLDEDDTTTATAGDIMSSQQQQPLTPIESPTTRNCRRTPDEQENESDDDDDDLKSISALSLISTSTSPTALASAFLLMQQQQQNNNQRAVTTTATENSFLHIHHDDDENEGSSLSTTRKEERDPDSGKLLRMMDAMNNLPSFVSSPLHLVNQATRILFPNKSEFSSVDTVRIIVSLLDEASLRLSSGSSSATSDDGQNVHSCWNRLALVCFEWLNRAELRGLQRFLENHIREHLMGNFHHQEAQKNNKNFNNNTTTKKQDQKRLLKRQKLVEGKVDEALLAPIDKLDIQSLFLMAKIFTRGKGWFWNDSSILVLRDIFDEQRVLYLFEKRMEIWARCVLAENVKFETIAKVPKKIGEESNEQKTNIDEEQKVMISSNFVVWALQKHILPASNKNVADTTNDKNNVLSYHILGYLFSVTNPPKDFDSLARTMLLLDK